MPRLPTHAFPRCLPPFRAAWIATKPGALLEGSALPALQAIWDGRVDSKHTLSTHTMSA